MSLTADIDLKDLVRRPALRREHSTDSLWIGRGGTETPCRNHVAYADVEGSVGKLPDLKTERQHLHQLFGHIDPAPG